MTLGLAFWIVVLVGGLLGWLSYAKPTEPWYPRSAWIILLLLVILLGLGIYGQPLHR